MILESLAFPQMIIEKLPYFAKYSYPNTTSGWLEAAPHCSTDRRVG